LCALHSLRVTGETGYRVLTTQPANNKDGYGDPVSTAHWWDSVHRVYSSIGLSDYHQRSDDLDYNLWRVSNVSWPDNCNVLQGQGGGWFVVAIGTGGNKDGLGIDWKYDCGAQ